MYRFSACPFATAVKSACSSGGGGVVDQAVQSRRSVIQGVSQLPTLRRALGQDGGFGGVGPPLSGVGE